jgi:transposase
MPFYRLSGLQELYGTPVAASTLWMQCYELWRDCAAAVYAHLVELAKTCKTFVLDDTGAKILEVIAKNKRLPVKEQRSCHTTGICTETKEGNKILLYITGNNYCGENFAPLVEEREDKHHYIKLITDASNQNIPRVKDEDELKQVIMAGCLSHGRQKFYELKDNYPRECGYFLQEIKSIYQIEEKCRNLCARKRLRWHKEHSSKHIANIYASIRQLYQERLVEPNSDLGKAMNYWVRHKKELTRFLRVKGIELDTNKAERALKSIILQRKNSLFFKTKDSAGVLSGLHSIVKTCKENGVNAYSYLNWIQDNWQKVQKNAQGYMPWDYLAYINCTELIAA